MTKVKPKRAAREGEGRPREVRPEIVTLADRLHSAAVHLLRRVRRQDASSGVGPAQLSALSVLVFSGPKTMGELATAEQVRPPTMSRIVAGLKRSRLIELARDPHDARRMRVRASPKGESLLQRGRRRRIESLAANLDGLTPKELAALDAALRPVERVLRAWHEPA